MDCKSLMIGDWVKIQDSPTYYQVHSIDKLDKGDAARLIFDDVVLDTWCDRLYPIPLTEEILKANGFKYITICTYELSVMWEYSVQVSLYNDGCVTSISKDLKCRGVNNCHICYQGHVHELQHALRLCGLNEFADNFKV